MFGATPTPQPRLIAMGENFDRKEYDRVFRKFHDRMHQQKFLKDQVEILHNLADNDPSEIQQYMDSAKAPSAQQLLDMEAQWHPKWFALPLAGMLGVFTKAITHYDVPNYIHPALRTVGRPAAVIAAAASVYSTMKFCKEAGLDNVTTGYQAGATASYQLLANFALPYTIFKTTTKLFANTKLGMGPRNTAVVYGAAAAALLTSLVTEKAIRKRCESTWMDWRLDRKDYGLYGQNFHDESLHHDNWYFDYPEHFWMGPAYGGNQYTFSETPGTPEDKKITEIFPGFALAEALPTFEVPWHSDEIVAHQPFYATQAIVDDAVEIEGQRSVPAITEGTMCRECTTKFGEWSLANNWEHAYDKAFGFDWYLKGDDQNALDRVRAFRAKYNLKQQEVKNLLFQQKNE
eukprot:UN03500